MSYCRYHPVEDALWSCPSCNYSYCNQCADEKDSLNQRRSRAVGQRALDVVHCFNCSAELHALPISNTAEPFWQRLDKLFRYPFATESLILLVIIALLSTFATTLPALFSILALIGLNGVLFKYCFVALRQTVDGEFTPPSITAAYGGGGTALFLQLFVLVVVGIVAAGLAFEFLGNFIGGLVSIFLVVSLPSMIILFACTDNLFRALNPFANLSLMTTIGLPYVLLLFFLFMMISSSGVLTQMTSDLGLVSTLLQMLISNYYTLVMFHLLGYIVYQYSSELGLASGVAAVPTGRSEVAYYRAKLDILLKEGRHQEMLTLYDTLVKKQSGSALWLESLMAFVLVSQNGTKVKYYGDAYIELLVASDKLEQVSIFYQRVVKFCRDFKPQKPENLLLLAQQLFDKGAYTQVLNLLHGCHKTHSQATQLGDLMTLMADCFAHLGRDADEQQYRKFIAKLN